MNEKDPKENVDDMHWRDATKDEIVELKKMFDIDDKIADHIRIIVDKDDNITEDTKKFMKVLKCNQKAHIHRLELLNQQKQLLYFQQYYQYTQDYHF